LKLGFREILNNKKRKEPKKRKRKEKKRKEKKKDVQHTVCPAGVRFPDGGLDPNAPGV
jgi:hypothetical protein